MPKIETPSIARRWDLIRDMDLRTLQACCWTALIAIAIVRAWFTRYEFGGDSVSYMDIGRMIAEGNPKAAVHAYWSPGYPMCLSFLWLFHPSAYWECPLVHLVNVLIFASSLASFQLFWSEARLWHERYVGGAVIPEFTFWGLGYSIFAVATLNVITVGQALPDMLVATFCLLAGWNALRLRRTPSIGRALTLGVSLALGYYSKAPFFPLGFVFILCASLGRPASRQRIITTGTALAVFLLICAPFIVAISLAKHRLTFGDSARLNQSFYINGVEHFVHWQGGPPGSGMPVHPTRRLNNVPATFEFATKDMGTYPPWFDPTVWYEGVTPHTNFGFQSKLFVANLILTFQIVANESAALICAVMILAMLGGRGIPWIKSFWSFWHIWVPGMIAMLMFALVHVESRFLGGWLILLFAAAVCASSLPSTGMKGWTVDYIGVAALVTVTVSLLSQASQEALSGNHIVDRSPRNAIIADYLLSHGLGSGSRVAVIGDGMYTYWAHLGHLRVVAEIPANTRWYREHPALDFWASGPEEQRKSLNILAQTGAEAVIADPQGLVPGSEPSVCPAGWQKIDGIDSYVYFFTRHRH
jgi:hypothetical protein